MSLPIGTTFTERMNIGDWLKGELETPKDYCRESVTVTTASFLVSGTALGKVTATGEYVPFDPAGEAAAPGTGHVAGLLVFDLAASGKAAVIVRGPATVYASKLSFLPNITEPQKVTALGELEALGILAVLEA